MSLDENLKLMHKNGDEMLKCTFDGGLDIVEMMAIDIYLEEFQGEVEWNSL